MRIIFVGPAGSGKGTQSSLLSKLYNIPAISTGALLRERAKENDEISVRIKDKMLVGDMVDDDIIFPILQERLSLDDCQNGFILDGFPRDERQAIILGEWLEQKNQSIDRVIVLNVPEDVVFKRITGRFECAKCGKNYNKYFSNTKVEGVCDDCQATEFKVRADDKNFDVIHKRLDIYKEMANAIINYYDKKNLICNIDALKSSSEIYQDILSDLKKISNKK